MMPDILLLYWAFSALFMIGYINALRESTSIKLVVYFIGVIIAPIMFPINIGSYIHKNL